MNSQSSATAAASIEALLWPGTYRALFASKLLTWRAAIVSTVLGAVAFLPLFVAMLWVARRLTS
jgi:hypothetical protein